MILLVITANVITINLDRRLFFLKITEVLDLTRNLAIVGDRLQINFEKNDILIILIFEKISNWRGKKMINN